MRGDIIVITIISIQTRISTLCNRGLRTRDGDDDHAEDAVGSIRQLLEELEGSWRLDAQLKRSKQLYELNK